MTEVYEDVDRRDVSFILARLQEEQPRGDYRELLELWLIALGETPPKGIRFLFSIKLDGWRKLYTPSKSSCFKINSI